MIIINNQVYYSPREKAVNAFNRLVEEGYDVERYSFISGYLLALEEAKEQE